MGGGGGIIEITLTLSVHLSISQSVHTSGNLRLTNIDETLPTCSILPEDVHKDNHGPKNIKGDNWKALDLCGMGVGHNL